jgi:hypothetical protein
MLHQQLATAVHPLLSILLLWPVHQLLRGEHPQGDTISINVNYNC